MTPRERAQQIVDALNEANQLDPLAVAELMICRVSCNEALADHPTIQVGNDGVGPLGLINGLVGVRDNDWGYIAMEWDEVNLVVQHFLVLDP